MYKTQDSQASALLASQIARILKDQAKKKAEALALLPLEDQEESNAYHYSQAEIQDYYQPYVPQPPNSPRECSVSHLETFEESSDFEDQEEKERSPSIWKVRIIYNDSQVAPLSEESPLLLPA